MRPRVHTDRTLFDRAGFNRAGLDRARRLSRSIINWVSRRRLFVDSAELTWFCVFAGGLTLWVACWFYSSLHLQTRFAALWNQPEAFGEAIAGNLKSEWSAPLDDVFIHFDFARATAQGFPFQWYPGNGYSSGGTSTLYPFVLAIGYSLGFSGLKIMHWAGMVACVCVLATLIAARGLFSSLPTWTAYLAPPALLGIGALSWSLFSGMEVALFLALWGGGFVAFTKLERLGQSARGSLRTVAARALALGAWGAALVATRPEGAVCVLFLGLFAAYPFARQSGARVAFFSLVLVGTPAALLLFAQALINRALTGDFSAAGALSKLEIYHPYLTGEQVFDAWLFHVKYQILRVTQYHFTNVAAFGWIVWVFAGLALVFPKTRKHAALLWSSAGSWVLVVALNGQVRWQNERYTMPAVAFLMLAAALGFAALLSYDYRKFKRPGVRVLVYAASLSGVAAFVWHQAPRFVEQVWFFGRASRNIYDQHVRAGRVLKNQLRARRVLLSDAGAIVYASDLPAVDLIGLGGYEGLPFARAGRLGAGAALELIERLPAAKRPDTMALYPSWWGTLPVWFGEKITEIPVRGNVICGGPSKVLYRADWSPFDGSATPAGTPKLRIADTLDVADIISESAHSFRLSQRGVGHVVMSMADQARHGQRVWDAGRLLGPGYSAQFALGAFAEGRSVTLHLRTTPLDGSRVKVRAGTHEVFVSGPKARGFSELEVTLPPEAVTQELEITLEAPDKTIAVYHLWALQ